MTLGSTSTNDTNITYKTQIFWNYIFYLRQISSILGWNLLVTYYYHIFEIDLLIRMIFFILFFVYMKSESAYLGNNITTISSAILNEEREKAWNISSVIINSNRRSNVYGVIFLGFLSFFRCQRISPWKFRFFFVCYSTGNRIWLGHLSEKTFQHSI